MIKQPLAEAMRPIKLKDVIGQEHLTAENKLLNKIINSDSAFSIILWGPPGSGKTTIARILSSSIKDSVFVELSAVSASKKDINKVIEDAKINSRLKTRTILFVDEIHRFSKSQQDAFLPHVENGLISFIGATTENPSFEVIAPLISRSQVIVLNKITKEKISEIIVRAIKLTKFKKTKISDQVINLIADTSDGDARKALLILEKAMFLSEGKKIDKKIIEEAIQTKLPSYDKAGDYHYGIISAFIKSMRGSDANATLYYLARMLDAGEDPKFIARRMIIFASEDIGVAASPALNLAVSTFLAVERIGMPECRYNLFHCATVLAKAEKSRVITSAMEKAFESAKKYGDLEVPIHLRNATSALMENLGYSKGYKWQADYKPKQGFLPKEISELNLF